MVTEFNYIPSREDDDEYVGHFFYKLKDVIHSHGYEQIKDRLWLLTKTIVSYPSEEIDIEYQKQTIKILKELISGAWHCKDEMRKEKYSHPSFSLEWTDNPYAQRKTDQDRDYKKRNIHCLRELGNIKWLSDREITNFTLAIDHFFDQLHVLNWFALLDKWEEYTTKRGCIFIDGWDDQPLTTYEELARLIEASFLAAEFLYSHLPEEGVPHNEHLYDSSFAITKLDATNTDVYNPLEHINAIFGYYSSSELLSNLDHWLECAITENKIWDVDEPGRLVEFHDTIVCIYEAGWLLTQGDQIPKTWLDPNRFKGYAAPKENLNLQGKLLLQPKQRANSARTLSILYRRTGLDLTKDHLAEALSYALQKKSSPYNKYSQVRIVIKKVIEILDMINRNVCQKYGSQ